MKAIKLILILGAIACSQLLTVDSFSQTISPKVIPACGGYFTGGGKSLSWTMGETFTRTFSSANHKLSCGFQQPELDVKTIAVTGSPFCNGDSIVIPFKAVGFIGSNNIFTAQLSSAGGSFASPVSLGYVTGNSSGTISTVIPFTTPAGSNYIIRVVSSLPNRVSNKQGAYQVDFCTLRLDFRAFIEGFYSGSGQMRAVLYDNAMSADPTACDSITVELHDATSPYDVVFTARGLIHTDGSAELFFPGSVLGNTYYIAIRLRNALETWSKNPLLFNAAILSFDFTSP